MCITYCNPKCLLSLCAHSSKSKDSLRYRDANDANLLRPVAESSTRVARVPSAYIRQMADEKLLIPGRSLTLMDTIGQGEFGVVYRGNLGGWRAEREHSLVAIKTLKGIFSTNDLSNMVEESVKMAKFNHPNVMRLIGVCIDKGASPYIVMPYMAYGSLLSYLKKQRAELTLANDEDQELVTATQCKLLSMCLQVAKGMSYLAAQEFVHRDMAARNCMIDENFVLKVADFGLSEDIYARNYFRQTGLQDSEGETPIKLPVRWMAVESLHDGIFTEKTDVWSFGVTMWEVFSAGKNPYPGVDPFTLIKHLDDGGRLEKPTNAACSQEIYTLMCDCWNEAPDVRPHFSTLVSTISETLESIAGYLHFSPDWLAGDGPTTSRYDHLMAAELSEMKKSSRGYDHLNPTVIVSDEHCLQQVIEPDSCAH
ncbi:Tyrosine-protein kinase transforming protein SEA [Geodia barretti]|uniref:Tyrosine-protein kinase transforming protein SEA n=1 Tax=Geodia barretti TaxID=519541 RepID=A0AA35SD81_GEOBA|nr:Tyrosine-protein kinase transforming protein SEA [Geodia barretti]